MPSYTHLSSYERDQISLGLTQGISAQKIARQLRRSVSTISREIIRNKNKDGSYRPQTAENRYLARRVKLRLLECFDELKNFVIAQLKLGWTPEQISGWLKAGNEKLQSVSHETIYAWIYDNAQKKLGFWRYLPRHKSKRSGNKARCPRNVIKDRQSIHDRPKEVEDRAQVGHWEGDFIICRNKPILVLQERKTRYVLAEKLEGRKADEVAEAIIKALQNFDNNLIILRLPENTKILWPVIRFLSRQNLQ